MSVTEAIYARRAVRSYAPRVVDEATIGVLLRAAVQAPSAMNRQPWLFVIVQDVARLKRYSDAAKAMLLSRIGSDPKAGYYASLLQSPDFNIFYDASTLVVIAVGERGPYAEADCWLAAENLMLAACELGLGTCPIGFAVPLLNSAEVRSELGIPVEGLAVAPILVGYPAAAASPVARHAPQIVFWSHGGRSRR